MQHDHDCSSPVSGGLVPRFIAVLLATFASSACGEGAYDETTGVAQAALDDSLDGSCFRIRWEYRPERYLDAYTIENGHVTTRPFEDSDTQFWCFTAVASGYQIEHRGFSGQFLDALTSAGDWRVVLRDEEFLDGGPHPSQVWRLNGNKLTQASTRRFLDAYDSAESRAVTRTAQSDGSQDWTIETECQLGNGGGGPVCIPVP